MGKHYLQWLEEQSDERQKMGLMIYALEVLGCPSDKEVPKAVRQKIYRCYKVYEDSCKNSFDYETNDLATRRRKKGNQGRPLKSPELNHLLFQWFVGYRKIVKGRLWPRTVLKEAIQIKARLIAWYRDNNKIVPDMPKLDLGNKGKRWLRRWKKRYFMCKEVQGQQ